MQWKMADRSEADPRVECNRSLSVSRLGAQMSYHGQAEEEQSILMWPNRLWKGYIFMNMASLL